MAAVAKRIDRTATGARPWTAAVAALLLAALPAVARADGTGFVVSDAGHVLTSHHVVEGCWGLEAVSGHDRQPAALVGSDPVNDLALVRIQQPFGSIARFRAGRQIRPGDGVVVVGYPLPGILASEANVTTGTVSANAGPGDDPRFLQISAPIQSGNSGGPLMDRSGNVVGMIFAKLDALALASVYGDIPQNINFAIKQETALRFLGAHRVPYRSEPSGLRLEPADIGEQAKRFTVFIRCLGPGDQPSVRQSQTRIGYPTPAPSPFATRPDDGAVYRAPNGELRSRMAAGSSAAAPSAGPAPSATPSAGSRAASLTPQPVSNYSSLPLSREALDRARPGSGTEASPRQDVPPADMPEPAGVLSAAIHLPTPAAQARPTRRANPTAAAVGSGARSGAGPGGSKARDWAIQVGAFRSFALADRAVTTATDKVPALLTDTEIVIVPTQTADGTLYRARLGGLDRLRATEACSQLKLRGIGCFVISADLPHN